MSLFDEEDEQQKGKYDDFQTDGRGRYKAQYTPPPNPPGVTIAPGIYEVQEQRDGSLIYNSIKNTHDDIIDLPNPAYEQVVSELETFLQPETKALFKEYGFLYKRSTILYGVPGTGKTIIANKIANSIIKKGGITIFDPSPSYLSKVFQELDAIQPDTTVCVIFEEFDEWLEHQEAQLLSILDGEIQRENVVYLCTTNYIERVPKRILRPGRMSTVVEVGFPTTEARRVYLSTKLEDPDEVAAFVEKTGGFSIDELSECVKAVKCLRVDIDDVVARILEAREANEKKSE